MATPTVQSGKAKGGFRRYFYRDVKGNYLPCEVLSGTNPYTIRIPSRLHLPAAQHTLSGIPLATSKASTNAVHPRVRT